MNIKESLLKTASGKSDLRNFNEIWIVNHLAHELTFKHLAKLAKLLSCVVEIYGYNELTMCFYHVTNLFRVNLLSVSA